MHEHHSYSTGWHVDRLEFATTGLGPSYSGQGHAIAGFRDQEASIIKLTLRTDRSGNQKQSIEYYVMAGKLAITKDKHYLYLKTRNEDIL